MENARKLDRKYYATQLLILAMLSSLIIIGAIVLHFIINFEDSDPEAIMIIYAICMGSILIMWIFLPPYPPLDQKLVLFYPR